MKCLHIFLIVLMLSNIGVAQDKEFEFGDISMEELRMTRYDKDTAAAAVILFDRGVTEISPLGTIESRHVRIKIFRKEAFNDWADVTLFSQRSSTTKIKGATYHLEQGKIITTTLKEDAIFKSRFNKYIYKVNFTLPNLSENSIIEYNYTLKSRSIYLPSWPFQYSIPVKYSEYLLNTLAPARTDIRGSLEVTTHESHYKDQYKRWAMENIPAFKKEPFMPHEDIYKSVINFWSALQSWWSLTDMLRESNDFGKILTGHNYLKKKVAKITTGQTNDLDKVKSISRYIKENITWNGVTDYLADDPKTVLERKTGSSGDINLLLGSMLKKADLPVVMALISTRNHGLIFKEFPSLKQFNDVICMVRIDSDSVMLDATEKMLPYNLLPERCLHYEGLLINPLGFDWISYGAPAKAKTSASADFILSDGGELTGKLTYVMEGYSAFEARKNYYEKGEESYIKDFIQEKNLDIKNSDIQNMLKYDKPVKEIYDVVISNQTSVSGDYIYLNPYLALREESNPFTEDKRTYPIDFVVPIEKVFLGTIIIPDGYVVEELPPSKVFTLPERKAKYFFNITQTGNRLSITTKLQQDATLFMQEEYPSLKEFYNLIVAKKSEQVVLKRKP